MFIRVDLPAPFSPSRAWISPRRSSKSMASLATSAPNRLVIPRSSSASASPGIGSGPSFQLLDLRRDVRDVARDDLLLDLFGLVRVLLARGVELAEGDAVVLELEQLVRAALERAVLSRLRGVEHGHVDLLLRRREDVVAEVALVGVDADALDALLLRSVERAQAALSGHL